MIIESLNIGMPVRETFHGKDVVTGISKQPVSGQIRLGLLGFEGDGVADLKHHGGTDKAVCVYSYEHYGYWEETLGVAMPSAAFGENFTVSGLSEDNISIGDIFQAGTALLQVTQPRQPCKTLAARYGRNDMVKLVADSGRTGFYFRVIEEGFVKKGDSLVLKTKDARNVTVSFASHTYHHNKRNCEAVSKVLAVTSLSASWRQSFQKLKEEYC